ncbi:GNAT family N-acetyltransferase [Kordiimonas aestuarii]|uniref:GNAT family N-acetyltransferase n=1 Tax=Kordiimonas aestuarii TaxID=1005925 RepID=UPI0021CE92CC|nr:GNAT family protein [Kordiimonas aestuarii]
MTDLTNWQARPTAGLARLEGTAVSLELLDWTKHMAGLETATCGAANADLWHYIPLGPFAGGTALKAAFDRAHAEQGWRTMVILCKATTEVLGMASYMRNREAHGSTEVGCVVFSHQLQRTTAATEALYLMARHVFEDLGYRRFEWKCNAANDASRRAAVRFGFTYEGTFRNDMVMKGANRDTAWYSMIDSEWPDIASAFRAWLSPENFDPNGQQQERLEACRAAL